MGVRFHSVRNLSIDYQEIEMNRRDLDRYKRVLVEKRDEISVTIAGAEVGSGPPGIPGRSVDKAVHFKPNFRSTCIKPTRGFYEQSRKQSLGLETAPLAFARFVRIQSHGPA